MEEEKYWKAMIRCELCGKITTFSLPKERYGWEDFVRIVTRKKVSYDLCPTCRMVTLRKLVGYDAHPSEWEDE